VQIQKLSKNGKRKTYPYGIVDEISEFFWIFDNCASNSGSSGFQFLDQLPPNLKDIQDLPG
jgi:hypothetical protein